jgi:UDP-2-acetamido-3-amino-2,3-dideoxy-glucuronate N-acetyltransferase
VIKYGKPSQLNPNHVKKNIALIGAGSWGKNHLRNLYQLKVINSVVEKSDEIIAQREEEFPGLNFLHDEESILNSNEIQGVIIASPAESHYQITKKCLLHGKDVLVEKPMALCVKEGEELVQLAQDRHRILMVGHILQYHSAVTKLKQMIDQDELGSIRYIYSNRLNIGKLRTEENVLWSFAPHDISLILMLMNGEEPKKVTASGGAYINRDILDTTLTVLEFENGVKGHIFVSWLHPFKEQKLVVVGSKKMVVFDDISEEKLFIYPHTITWENGYIPVAKKAEYEVIPLEKKQPLKQELLHFIRCIETREKPRTDAREGLNVLKVLERAQRALKVKNED